MGTAIGIFYIVGGVISLGAGSIAGYISNNSLSGIFYFGAITSFIALVFLAFRNNSSKTRERVNTLSGDFVQRSEAGAEA